MSKKQKIIIVGMDFSPFAYSALEYATVFAKMHQATILMVHALEPAQDFREFIEDDKYWAKKEEEAMQKLNQLKETYQTQGIELRKVIHFGRSHQVLIKTSQQHSAELLFMGSHGQGGKEPVMGSTAFKVLRISDCPVIVVPEEISSPRLKNIMIPVDPEFGIREVRHYLKELPNKFKGKLILVGVTPPGDHSEKELGFETHLQKQVHALNKIGYEHVTYNLLEHSTVSRALEEFTLDPENGVDLVMMETHGRKGLAHFFVGSVTEHLVGKIKVPVFALCPDRRSTHYPSQWRFQ